MTQKRAKRYRKLRIKFIDNDSYIERNKNLIGLCSCLGKIEIVEPEVHEILTYSSLTLTLAKGLNRERVMRFLISQHPTISITVLGLKWHSSMKLP